MSVDSHTTALDTGLHLGLGRVWGLTKILTQLVGVASKSRCGTECGFRIN